MKSRRGPGRAGSLVLELAARTVFVDGQRVELPPTEFSLLAVLAARPGEVVPHKELLREAFGDSACMDAQDLHWRIWNIRKLIGDTDKTIIRNRRGVGFLLEQGSVQVIEGVGEAPAEPAAYVIRLNEEPQVDPQTPDAGAGAVADEPARRRFVLRPLTLLALGLVAGLALGASWLAGYTLSQRGEPRVATVPPTAVREEPRDEQKETPSRTIRKERTRNQRNDGRKTQPREQGGSPNFAIGPSGTNEVTPNNRTSAPAPASPGIRQQPAPRPKVDSDPQPRQPAPPPPPPPQPNAQLYHLHHPDTGDHIMTTSSSVANQKQAAGYASTPAGGVFTSQEKGTAAIALDGGTAYVYASPSSAPEEVTVTALYRLSSGDDFFYTTSSSAANQAQAQGWARSTGGYVAT